MRFSRGCYAKFHCCPGWIGGGPKYARVKRCDGGRLVDVYGGRLWRWRFQRCNTCDVTVWPYFTQYLSPFQWWHHAVWRIRNWIYLWRSR